MDKIDYKREKLRLERQYGALLADIDAQGVTQIAPVSASMAVNAPTVTNVLDEGVKVAKARKKVSRRKKVSTEKTCLGCGLIFPIEEFMVAKGKTKGEIKYVRCRNCRTVYSRAKMRSRRTFDPFNVRSFLLTCAGGACARCGYNEFSTALEFHHLEPQQKESGVGALINRFSYGGGSEAWLRIVNELTKCVVLCSNCHQALHNGSFVVNGKLVARRLRADQFSCMYTGE